MLVPSTFRMPSTGTSHHGKTDTKTSKGLVNNGNTKHTMSSERDDWCTIESDPGVFTELLESLGCQGVELQELWSLDDDSLVQLRLGAVYGFIFLFQWIGVEQAEHASRKEPLDENDIPQDLFFAHQVTTNACATQAILSVVLNAPLPSESLGPTLTEFKAFTSTFPPSLNGIAISSSETIKNVHNSFTRRDGFLADDSQKYSRATNDQQEAFHFVAYVPCQGIVYELDGLQKGPIVVGAYDAEHNSESSWIETARSAIQERMIAASNVKFNLMAVTEDRRVALQRAMAHLDDDHGPADLAEQMEIEQMKRDNWKVENQRRRHGYMPLCVNLLRELARLGKLSKLVDDAKGRQSERKKLKVKHP